jgi:hypothetical protein
VASAQQVWEFSRSFLGGNPGWVIVIKIFMDETNTHDGAQVLAVGAYMSRPVHWRDWTKAWNIHKRRVPKGRKPIKVYHATDCAGFHREFDGWCKEERDAYVAQLLPVIPAHKLAGIVIGIDIPTFTKSMRPHPEVLEMFGTPYAACFQWAVSFLMDFATKYGSGERMAFVHEINDFKEDALKAFTFVQEFINPRKIPMTIGFGSKDDYPPLQSADVLAYEGAKFMAKPADRPERRAWTALDPDKKRIFVLRYAKPNMDDLVKRVSDFRQALLEAGWDGKPI